MQWRGRRESSNLEDLRGQPGAGGRRLGGGGGLNLIMIIGRMFGLRGILIALVAGLVLWQLGWLDPRMFIEGGGSPIAAGSAAPSSPLEQERFDFVKVVLADTEDVWQQEFERLGRRYTLPVLAVFRGSVRTACGTGMASSGPFYCPGDQKVYIDLGFYDELERSFDSPGDFAQAYVIAHEVGHHVQKLLGTLDKVQAMRGRPDYNEYSVRLELQADFLAGVWAHHNSKYLERGDIEEAMRAAYAIGDDAIQSRMRGRVLPHAFTHGTSEQRMRWFSKGLKSGRIEEGDTFSMPYSAL